MLLIGEERQSLASVLRLLETHYHLHMVAEPLRLVIETEEDQREHRRRLVDLDLARYGVHLAPMDFPGPTLGPDRLGWRRFRPLRRWRWPRR